VLPTGSGTWRIPSLTPDDRECFWPAVRRLHHSTLTGTVQHGDVVGQSTALGTFFVARASPTAVPRPTHAQWADRAALTVLTLPRVYEVFLAGYLDGWWPDGTIDLDP